MATILLDTSVILDHLNDISEVYAGLRAGEEAKKKAFFETLEFIPVTSEVAERAGL